MLDFSKAFDKVSPSKLLHKIRHYGITNNTNNWIKAFLENRSQQIVVNGQASNPAAVLSGVPQGTVLGPMLFLLYINDIPEGVHSMVRLFADDSIVYREIMTPQDHIGLNNDTLDTLHKWVITWQMDFNVSKCTVLSITPSKPSIYDYVMNGEKIPRTGNHDYLGVTINSKLSWKPHINKVQSKASRTLELIKRMLHAALRLVSTTAYEALVRPTLEYAKCAWSPYPNVDTQRTKRV